jgi:hypothetical protein
LSKAVTTQSPQARSRTAQVSQSMSMLILFSRVLSGWSASR